MSNNNIFENIEEYLFGPLPREYCLIYYFLSVWSYILFLIVVSTAVYSGIFIKQRMITFMLFSSALNYFFMYIVLRLQHTMCVNALH